MASRLAPPPAVTVAGDPTGSTFTQFRWVIVSTSRIFSTFSPGTTVSGLHPCMVPFARTRKPLSLAQFAIRTTSSGVRAVAVHTASNRMSLAQLT